MNAKNPERQREDRNRAAWYGIAQVEDSNFLHQKSSRLGCNQQGESDLIAPLHIDDGGEISKSGRIFQVVGFILIVAAIIAITISFFAGVSGFGGL